MYELLIIAWKSAVLMYVITQAQPSNGRNHMWKAALKCVVRNYKETYYLGRKASQNYYMHTRWRLTFWCDESSNNPDSQCLSLPFHVAGWQQNKIKKSQGKFNVRH